MYQEMTGRDALLSSNCLLNLPLSRSKTTTESANYSYKAIVTVATIHSYNNDNGFLRKNIA